MLRPTILSLLVLAGPAAPPAPVPATRGVAADTLGRFPRVEGESLTGTRLVLPGDFAGTMNVVLVAFARDQQRDVDGWMPFLTAVRAARGDVRVHELPTLGRRYRPMRSFIDGGMRRGIPDPAVRAATVTLYIDKTPFRRALGLGGEDDIYVLLVDRDGRVHWRAAGRFDAAKGAELDARARASLGALGARPGA